MIGQSISHFKIVAKLGQGGMGAVYRAQDLKLGREVAVKLLPPEMAADPARLERFRREAMALAALDHPNIVTVHSVEEVDGQHFLTMGLVEGATFGQLIPASGLPLDAFFDIAIPLADALAAAHEKGVVHRDLKPDNVMLSRDGRVKVLDFGLAKLSAPQPTAAPDTETVPAAALTRDGIVMGTAPYMSPEQIDGRSIDTRSDIFSLGIILYEMLTGVRPFRGDSSAALISSILKDTPRPVTEIKADLPRHLGRILERCLEKDRERRYQTAKDVRNEIELLQREIETERSSSQRTAPGSAPSQAAEKSIAVLPFINRSPDPEDEYFSDGMTEEIINALSQLEGLRVAARSSTFSFKHKNADLYEIGGKLGVNTVLEGSVRKAGNRLRITAQLINVEDGYHLWSERYDRELTDVFEVQDEIATAIASRLRVTLSGSDEQKLARRGTSNLEAYELFLKGRVLQYRRGRGVIEALPCFEQAVALDPEYADAHAWMGDSHRLLGVYGFRTASDAMPLARAAAERALALDPNVAEAHATLADVAATYDFDAPQAFRSWERALTLNPNHLRARCEYALWGLSLMSGKMEEAVAEVRRAIESEPHNAFAAGMHSLILGLAGRYEEAIAEVKRAVALDADSFIARWMMAEVYCWAGDYDAAISAAKTALLMSGRHPWALAPMALAYANLGNAAYARAIYDELQARARSEHVQDFWLAAAACAAGEVDEALAIAHRAVDNRDPLLTVGWRFPDWARLRAHPGFPDLWRRTGLA